MRFLEIKTILKLVFVALFFLSNSFIFSEDDESEEEPNPNVQPCIETGNVPTVTESCTASATMSVEEISPNTGFIPVGGQMSFSISSSTTTGNKRTITTYSPVVCEGSEQSETDIDNQSQNVSDIEYSWGGGTSEDYTSSSFTTTFETAGTRSVSCTVSGTPPANCASGSFSFSKSTGDIDVIAVTSISALKPKVCKGDVLTEDDFEITTNPSGYEDEISFSVPDTSSAGVKTVTVTYGTSSVSTEVTVVEVSSITYNGDSICLGESAPEIDEYTIVTNPTGNESMFSLSTVDTSTAGTKYPYAICSNGSYDTSGSIYGELTVVEVSSITYNGDSICLEEAAPEIDEYTIVTNPPGHEAMFSLSDVETLTLGTKYPYAICSTGSYDTSGVVYGEFDVVTVSSISPSNELAFCVDEVKTYTTTPTSGEFPPNQPNWEVTGGTIQAGGQPGDLTVTVIWDTPSNFSGDKKVKASCGEFYEDLTLTVVEVKQKPFTFIPTFLKRHQNGNYSMSVVAKPVDITPKWEVTYDGGDSVDLGEGFSKTILTSSTAGTAVYTAKDPLSGCSVSFNVDIVEARNFTNKPCGGNKGEHIRIFTDWEIETYPTGYGNDFLPNIDPQPNFTTIPSENFTIKVDNNNHPATTTVSPIVDPSIPKHGVTALAVNFTKVKNAIEGVIDVFNFTPGSPCSIGNPSVTGAFSVNFHERFCFDDCQVKDFQRISGSAGVSIASASCSLPVATIAGVVNLNLNAGVSGSITGTASGEENPCDNTDNFLIAVNGNGQIDIGGSVSVTKIDPDYVHISVTGSGAAGFGATVNYNATTNDISGSANGSAGPPSITVSYSLLGVGSSQSYTWQSLVWTSPSITF